MPELLAFAAINGAHYKALCNQKAKELGRLYLVCGSAEEAGNIKE